MSQFQNSVSFGTGFRKSGLKPSFSSTSKGAVPKSDILKPPQMLNSNGIILGFSGNSMGVTVKKPVKPVFKRQRFLLSFIKGVNESCSATDLQKLLFLHMTNNNLTYYEFVPYMYGCYSIQAAEDIDTLHANSWLTISDGKIRYAFTDSGKHEAVLFFDGFPDFDLKKLPKERGNKLIKLVYERYPYYAINSRITGSILGVKGLALVEAEKKRFLQSGQMLFTIGYEGLSIEKYLNLLIQNNVRTLCDVRNNPLSRKFGFSRKNLQNYLGHIGIEYVHIPELGIVSEKRNNLNSDADYAELFKDYESSLPAREKSLKQVHQILQTKGRVALTCFEHEPSHCHRHVIRDYFKKTYSVETLDL
jgi:uncharacterized protein YwgA